MVKNIKALILLIVLMSVQFVMAFLVSVGVVGIGAIIACCHFTLWNIFKCSLILMIIEVAASFLLMVGVVTDEGTRFHDDY